MHDILLCGSVRQFENPLEIVGFVEAIRRVHNRFSEPTVTFSQHPDPFHAAFWRSIARRIAFSRPAHVNGFPDGLTHSADFFCLVFSRLAQDLSPIAPSMAV
jgi:hypothetical protein